MTSRYTLRAAGLLLPLLLVPAAGCKSAYYATMEKFGVHKRDILVDRVGEAREQQVDAQEQFKTTYEVFKELAGTDGGELEKVYNRLDKEYGRCEDEATAVTERIDSIEKVAGDLFSEWEKEIDQISDPNLAREDRRSLEETRKRSSDLVAVMRQAEARMEPVLTKFKDNVLFLKHRLNAQAIASLQDTVIQIGGDIDRLIADMNRSIEEADNFINAMETSS